MCRDCFTEHQLPPISMYVEPRSPVELRVFVVEGGTLQEAAEREGTGDYGHAKPVNDLMFESAEIAASFMTVVQLGLAETGGEIGVLPAGFSDDLVYDVDTDSDVTEEIRAYFESSDS